MKKKKLSYTMTARLYYVCFILLYSLMFGQKLYAIVYAAICNNSGIHRPIELPSTAIINIFLVW